MSEFKSERWDIDILVNQKDRVRSAKNRLFSLVILFSSRAGDIGDRNNDSNSCDNAIADTYRECAKQLKEALDVVFPEDNDEWPI